MKKKRGLLIYPVLITVLTYLPVIVVVIYSFNASKLTSVWGGWSLKWYSELFADHSIPRALFTTLALGLLSSLLSAAIATPAALCARNTTLPLFRLTEKLSMTPMIIPEIVLGMVFLAYYSLLQLPFGFLTLLLAHTSFGIPYVYMEVNAALARLDPSVTEAARDLGAGRLRAFFTVTLPMLTPALLSGMFLSFAMSLDDVIISIFVTGVEVTTLPIKIYTQLKTGLSPKIYALCTLLILAVIFFLILFTAVRKYITKLTGPDSGRSERKE